MLTPHEARARAQAGAQYLDETQPGWPARINLDTLDVSSKCRCVLGQLHGSFDAAIYGGDDTDGNLLSVSQREEYGFTASYQFNSLINDYRLLTAAWRELIATRQTVFAQQAVTA